MTQQEKILNYIERFGSISTMEAFRDLGVTRLAARISDMEKCGIIVGREMISSKNRFGEPIHYMKYSIIAKPGNIA